MRVTVLQDVLHDKTHPRLILCDQIITIHNIFLSDGVQELQSLLVFCFEPAVNLIQFSCRTFIVIFVLRFLLAFLAFDSQFLQFAFNAIDMDQ